VDGKIKNMKKNITIITIGLVLFITTTIVVYYRFIDRSKTTPPITTIEKGENSISNKEYSSGLKPSDIVPGVSGKDDLLEKIGDPKEELEDGYAFNSNSPTRPHEAKLEDDTLTFFKEIITSQGERTIFSMKSAYGNPDYILYGERAGSGDYLYIHPSDGVAYIGNAATNSIIEVWYFEATSIDNFKSRWASNYIDNIENLETHLNSPPF